MISNIGPRITREKDIVSIMVHKYCTGQKHSGYDKGKDGANRLCPSCKDLLQYAHTRLSRCQFGENKTTCGRCPIHCYKPQRRVEIKEVMRYAGPRMLWTHPIESLRHALDGKMKLR
ncbi:nitrous oxide-stimulated promoter family protein [Paenibacillus sp. CMAA1364]